jgi:hypothetical protein
MKLSVISFIILILSSFSFSSGRVIVLRLDPNKHCIDEKKRGDFLTVTLKPKTKYFVMMVGKVYLSEQTGNDADPVNGMMTYYRAYENGKNVDRYKVLKHKDRFVFTTASTNPVFTGFIMEIFSKRNNMGTFKITLRELGPAR